MNKKISHKGFLILEVMIAILILAVAFAVFMSAMAQTLRVSVRAKNTAEALSRFDSLLFEIESGIRIDLASYGGRADLKDDYQYEIQAQQDGDFGSRINSRLLWKNDKELLNLDLLVLKVPIQ